MAPALDAHSDARERAIPRAPSAVTRHKLAPRPHNPAASADHVQNEGSPRAGLHATRRHLRQIAGKNS